MKFARAVVIAVVALLMAVTPLSALIAPGEFEVRYAERLRDPLFTVRLTDRTGLARGLAVASQRPGIYDAITSFGVDGRMLIVQWDGSTCDYLTHLTFERGMSGFLIHERTERSSCVFGSGRSSTVAIHLWAPVDAATVEFVSLY